MIRPAESPGGLRKYEPALGIPSGWCCCRQRRISSSLAAISSGLAGASSKVAQVTVSGAPGALCLSADSR
jgi:hypothetical protein